MITKPIKDWEDQAREQVGDGKTPNIYFTSKKGIIQLITVDFSSAYSLWKTLVRDFPDDESSLEDRKCGTLASRWREDEGSTKLVTQDDTNWIRK